MKNWERHFEGAKSKTYNNKTSCSMPCKHGLGYKRLIRSKNGPALFGAWCALLQVLSRHNKTRQGYCTDTGVSDGKPYTPSDLEMLTDIPATVIQKMLDMCCSQDVGWMSVTKVKDTTGDYEGTILPLNLDSDLDLNSDSTKEVEEVVKVYNATCTDMPTCLKLNDKRRSQIKARIKEVGFEELLTIITNCGKLDFLNGKNNNGWKADLEWITKDSNFTKIREGKYDNKTPQNQSSPRGL